MVFGGMCSRQVKNHGQAGSNPAADEGVGLVSEPPPSIPPRPTPTHDIRRLPTVARCCEPGPPATSPWRPPFELLIGHSLWLDRFDQEGLTSVSEQVDGSTQLASIEWDDVVDRLDDTSGGGFPDSGSAVTVLAIATSLGRRRPVDLGELPRLDTANATLVTQATAALSTAALLRTTDRPPRSRRRRPSNRTPETRRATVRLATTSRRSLPRGSVRVSVSGHGRSGPDSGRRAVCVETIRSGLRHGVLAESRALVGQGIDHGERPGAKGGQAGGWRRVSPRLTRA